MSKDIGPQGSPPLKRKRVSRACDTCRGKKLKCDGRRPVCSRCAGYGYSCLWDGVQLQAASASQEHQQWVMGEALSPRQIMAKYQTFVLDLCSTLPDGARSEVAASFDRIQVHVDHTLQIQADSGNESQSQSQSTHPESDTAHQPAKALAHIERDFVTGLTPGASHRPSQRGQRYLGEVSDIHFFNLVKLRFKHHDTHMDEDNVDSYDQHDEEPATTSPASIAGTLPVEQVLVDLPSYEVAQRYLDAYFSTIHNAYPFVPRSSFTRRLKKQCEHGTGIQQNLDPVWDSLVFAILAIGAYYVSSGSRDSQIYQEYFRRCIFMTQFDNLERSVLQVSALLAQCFYLLSIARTDRCWTTLGLAIRLAQSLGLHVDSNVSKQAAARDEAPAVWPERVEIGRRVWHSLYVLDHLIALQLGRPPAICDSDCYVALPVRADDADHDWDAGELDSGSKLVIEDGQSAIRGHYFLTVITFSTIVGRVLRELYRPRPKSATNANLQSTLTIDGELLLWKQSLPRYLRFDVGHAFETSVTLRRQRNNLAIKFHHLRALIHRPHLSFLDPKGGSKIGAGQLDGQAERLRRCEAICISEAQETARLLHHVRDEKDLIHNYPWWQMISCLVCAGSILIVAKAILEQRHNEQQRPGVSDDASAAGGGGHGLLEAETLGDDAETCVKVLEALAHNSDGARIARDMMCKLKAQSARLPVSVLGPLQSVPAAPFQPSQILSGASCSPPAAVPQPPYDQRQPLNMPVPLDGTMELQIDDNGLAPNLDPSLWFQDNSELWPMEISDSIVWSSQFFSAMQGPS